MSMGCCLSQENRDKRMKSKEIDRFLKDESKKLKSEIKLLLLGAGESGKTTFIKQMRIIHGKGYNVEEKREFIKLISQNTITAMQVLIRAMNILNIHFENEENSENAARIQNIDVDSLVKMENDWSDAIKALWQDKGVQDCFGRRNQFQIIDSAQYFFENLSRIEKPDYLPNEQDILRSRVQTTGIKEYEFIISNLKFRIVDVGGQRSERKKWLHCFEQVMSVIFLVAISEYDQVLYEEEDINRLEESRNLFRQITDCTWFMNSSFMLFLNKKDVFDQKIKFSHLEDHFTDYTGPKCDAHSAGKFIQDLFESQKADDKTMYSHFTCATDTQNITVVFESVKDTIIRKMREDFGIY